MPAHAKKGQEPQEVSAALANDAGEPGAAEEGAATAQSEEQVAESSGPAHGRARQPRRLRLAIAIAIAVALVAILAAAVYLIATRDKGPAHTPLVITEISPMNSTTAPLANGEYQDWVELCNVSDAPVDLAGFRLSDKQDKLEKRELPSRVLQPGEYAIVYCEGDPDDPADGAPRMGFGLNSVGEALWLSDAAGNSIDYIEYPADIPIGGTYGRMVDESYDPEAPAGFSLTAVADKIAGLFTRDDAAEDAPATLVRMLDAPFYFTQGTPGAPNENGWAGVSAPVSDAKTPAGVYDDVENVTVEFAPEGASGSEGEDVPAKAGDSEPAAAFAIHYTTDGSLPTVESPVYTQPIVLTQTTAIRALCVEEGKLPSRVRSFTYFVNEHITLPLLSLNADSPRAFDSMYGNANKNAEVVANLTYYEDGAAVWSRNGGVSMTGFTSLKDPKKSMAIKFRGSYGDGTLDYDVFGTGLAAYDGLSIRAGQDYQFGIVRNELFQDLACEAAESNGGALVSQHGKYCILFVNGDYRGIYCLKEDLNRAFYANLTGSEKKNVDAGRAMFLTNQMYQEFFVAGTRPDMSDPVNYERYASTVDIDALIDWFLMEGYCCNSDTLNNQRYFRSTDKDGGDGKWHIAFYDLDWAWYYIINNYTNVLQATGNGNKHTAALFQSLLRNTEFREKCISRFYELNTGILSNEHVLAHLNELAATVQPEVARDRQRWGGSYGSWERTVENLRKWITERDMQTYCMNHFCQLLNVTQDEKDRLFVAKAPAEEGAGEAAEAVEGEAGKAADA